MNKLNKNNYNKLLDILRVISLIGVFLYHLNILPGGFLAVSIFFVLSGYLGCKSLQNKENISLKKYYFNKLKKLYLPLLIVTFSSITLISFIKDFNYLNLKPEVNSVILGYNNFWQLNASLDYFTRHIDSPFMHFWYIAILLQFELIFPFIYLLLDKLKQKTNKNIPFIIYSVLSFLGIGYFIYLNYNSSIMNLYYNTFSRIYAIFLGITLAYIPLNNKFKNDIFNKVCYYLYLIIIIFLFIFVKNNSNYLALSMILVTLISLKLIYLSNILSFKDIKIFDKIIRYFSNISYFVYLFQYPIIFTFQYININYYLKLILIITITLLLSTILSYAFKLKEKKLLKILILSIYILISLYGFCIYLVTKDHTEEMVQLDNLLKENANIIEKNNLEYKKKLQEENNIWQEQLNNLDSQESELATIVGNLPIVGIGDSVLLGAVNALYNRFPNGYFNGKVSRTAYEASPILYDLINSNALGEPIVFHLGANGDCYSCRLEIMNILSNKEVFWMTVTNDYEVYFNDKIWAFANQYSNLHIIDWNTISKGHYEYFASDGLHLTESGRIAFANAIYDSIYQVYLDRFNKEKQSILEEHEQTEKAKISFYGNDLLINLFSLLDNEYNNANFITDTNMTYDSLIIRLEEDIKNNAITHNIIIMLDSKNELTIGKYNKLTELLQDKKLYLVLTNKLEIESNNDNIKIVNLYKELENNPELLLADKIHLSNEGNIKLKEMLLEIIN